MGISIERMIGTKELASAAAVVLSFGVVMEGKHRISDRINVCIIYNDIIIPGMYVWYVIHSLLLFNYIIYNEGASNLKEFVHIAIYISADIQKRYPCCLRLSDFMLDR